MRKHRVGSNPTADSMKITFLILALVFGFLRIHLQPHGLHFEDTFKDLAHVFVGAVFGVALVKKEWFYWLIFTALIVLEVASATGTAMMMPLLGK